ncbi:polysaccharide deacetylase family protein [Parapedobacter sp. GCM10030251]|jgi:Predicted xylanase/chitin deacetylase|uniref:polysaccharide deacetylase family protein n=1 Tax=Parapedobacter sp. GCM10030251 TaxID=3273419 RepID=UPI00361F0202
MTGLIIGLLLAAFVTLALGVFNIQWNFFVKAIHRATTSTRQIALTFDDGPHPTYTPQVLTQLEKYGIQATFFCIGKHAATYPHLIKELHRRDHVVGNHSFTHASTIDFHTRTKWLMEIQQTDGVIEQTLGKRPRFFRPPYGVTTPHLAKALKETNHAIIGWRVRPYDTLNRSSEQIVRTILRKTKPGDIILLHDTHERIVPVLEQLLPALKHRKFDMVTVENLIQQDAYKQD